MIRRQLVNTGRHDLAHAAHGLIHMQDGVMDALILIEQNNIAMPTHDFGNQRFYQITQLLTVANLNCRIRSNPEVQTSAILIRSGVYAKACKTWEG